MVICRLLIHVLNIFIFESKTIPKLPTGSLRILVLLECNELDCMSLSGEKISTLRFQTLLRSGSTCMSLDVSVVARAVLVTCYPINKPLSIQTNKQSAFMYNFIAQLSEAVSLVSRLSRFPTRPALGSAIIIFVV